MTKKQSLWAPIYSLLLPSLPITPKSYDLTPTSTPCPTKIRIISRATPGAALDKVWSISLDRWFGSTERAEYAEANLGNLLCSY